MKKNIIQRTLALVLTIAALAMTQAAMAVSTFTIEPEGNGNTFKIKRSDTSKAETVKYYTISLSALAGVHFTKTDGEYTFPVGTDSYSVTVPETAVNYIAAKYLYYSGSGHTYRFLVADKNGFEYAHLDRTLTYDGYALTNDSPFGVKDVVIQSAEYTADDDGYDVNGYKSVSSSDYFNNAAPKGYFSAIGAQLRMTLSFEAKENDDAYEYLQLLVNNTSTCDNRSGSSNGDPGNINLSKYMAGFEMNTGAKDDTYRSYTFPVLSAGDNEGATNPWNHGTNWPLRKQKFNGNRATDGRIIIPSDFSTLVLRLNASGSSGSDEWAAKNVKAHIQAVDNTAPTLESITLAGGTYVRNTSCYITLDFSEPVIVTGTPELSTSWGSLAYLSGSGTNVLTFYRKELDGGGAALTVSRLMNVNQVSDLAGNAFSGTVSKSFPSVSAQKITLFDDYVKFKDLAGSYPVSSTPAEPKPSIGVYCGPEVRSLSLNSSYTRTYSNNTEKDIVPGTGIITITGTGIYTGTVSAEFNTRWATSSVAFKKNHDGHTITMTDQTFTYNQPQALKANIMTRSGYAFNGWNTEADGSGTAYTDGQELTNPSSTGTFTNGATLTLYAQWTPITYTLRLHHNDGTEAYTDMAMTYDQPKNIQSISRTGYVLGWSTTADGAVVYTDQQEVLNLTVTDGTIIDLYAKWTPITYTLRLHHNDGTDDYTDMAMSYDQAQNIQNIQSIPRTGYACLGWSTSANGDVVYTARQLVSNLTVTDGAIIGLYAKWGTDVWGVTQGKDGSSAEKAYTITTTAGLDLLAQNVNSGNNYSGEFFKLDADMAYDPTALDANGENYTAIGNFNTRFQGTFDGDGHTVSGIRINKTGSTDADRKQGLFGYIEYGTVQNVILNDAHITGWNQVGGITGDMHSATIKNCLVLNTAIVADGNSSNVGAISGINSGTLTANYYYNCTLTKGGTTRTTNIGIGSADRDGAHSVHTLTLPANVNVTAAESVTYNNVTYYASNTTVTLSPALGYILTNVTVNGTAGTDNGDDTWSFTMPAADATVTAALSEDPNGPVATVEKGSTVTAYYIDDINTTAADVLRHALNEAANNSGFTVKLLKNVTLANGDNIECISGTYTLDLNGHSITGNNDDFLLRICSNQAIQGGSITNTGSGTAIEIYQSSNGTDITHYITNCTITGNVGILITSEKQRLSFIGNTIKGCAYAGILIPFPVNFKGLPHFGTGSDANGCDIVFFDDSHSSISFLKASNQAGYYDVPATPITVKAVEWDALTNTYIDMVLGAGAEFYTFATGCNNIQYPNTNTTIPIEEVFRSLNSDYIVRTMRDGNTQLTKLIVLADDVDNTSTIETYTGGDCAVSLQGRTLYKDGYWNTLCVPFGTNDISTTPLAGAEIRSLESASLDDDGLLTLNFSNPITALTPGTPYIIKWSPVQAENLVNPFFPSIYIYNRTNDFTSDDGKVQFLGTYAPINFTPGDKSILFLGAENTLYYPEEGAHINAFRAYFQLNDPSAQVKAFVLNFGEGDDTETGIVSMEDVRGKTEDVWYNLSGRKLSGKHTQRGIYINNGRKVVIK